MPTRVEAVRLVERANQVSTTAGMPDFRTDVSFHAYAVDGTRSDGAIHRMFTPDGQYLESIYPPVHGIAIFTGDQIVQNEYVPPPPEIDQAFRLLPVRLLRFDESDVIQSISEATILGRSAKCIRFDTTNGKTTQANEVCVDVERGTLLRRHIGDEIIENADYFQIGRIWLPHQIRQYINGKIRMEEEQIGSLLEAPIDLMTLEPPNPQILHKCKQFRPAIGQSMPQPAQAGGGPWYDVEIHIVIWPDGRVHESSVLPRGRPDLEKEAVRLVQSWQFAPATCEDRPVLHTTNVTIHFPPQ
jgi:TonB family protein